MAVQPRNGKGVSEAGTLPGNQDSVSGVGRLLDHRHLEDLRKSGLNDAMIAAMQAYTADGFNAADMLSMTCYKRLDNLAYRADYATNVQSPLGPCLVFPYLDASGTPTGYVRVKPDNPPHRQGWPSRQV